MPRFAHMLKASYEARGYRVEVWSPQAHLFKRVPRGRFSKWAGYVDQYVLFPIWVRNALKRISADTLFVFCDQALGPWVPLVKHRPHVVHVHDLLALRSALGDLAENGTSITGRIYQRYIRHGFQQARHFISVSKKTRDDLQRFGKVTALTSEVVYNGFNFPYAPTAQDESRRILQDAGLPVSDAGMLLHVGGGQWYKNLAGVIALYAHYSARENNPLPLWCISPQPNAAVKSALSKVPRNGRVLFFQGLDNRALQAAYSYARAFLFPSLAEGFGWPLAEAQACGCPVITTDEPPMNEVAGEAAFYLPRLRRGADIDAWAAQGAIVLGKLLSQSAAERAQRVMRGRLWAGRFDADKAIEDYLAIYRRVLDFAVTQSNVEPGLSQGTRV
jgi:glycosyltransferase involved in cell wall biosynthesis